MQLLPVRCPWASTLRCRSGGRQDRSEALHWPLGPWSEWTHPHSGASGRGREYCATIRTVALGRRDAVDHDDQAVKTSNPVDLGWGCCKPLAMAWLAAACSCPPVPASPPAPPPPTAEPASPVEPVAAAVAPVAEGVPHPVVRRQNYRVEFGPYAFEVDPVDGARIVAFALDGRSVVVPREESPEAYGSSFWTSPQSDWVWPPPLELDRRAWKVSVVGSALVLRSEINQKLGWRPRRAQAPQ